MITSFAHKGLQELFTSGRTSNKTSKLPQERVNKINSILGLIHAAIHINDLKLPGFTLHPLKAPPYEGHWSIDNSGNFRIVFQFYDGKATSVTYLDTH